MINSEVFIIKRDGKKETFSLDKIKNAIAKAFLSVGSFMGHRTKRFFQWSGKMGERF